MNGYSWCVKCGRYAEFGLTGYSEPCECHNGDGRWWQVKGVLFCACGEPLRWMHQSPPEPLEWTMPALSKAQERQPPC